jgi:hypothetical protein
MTSMTSEALRAAPDIWKRPNLPPGVSKDEKNIDFAKIRIIIVVRPGGTRPSLFVVVPVHIVGVN